MKSSFAIPEDLVKEINRAKEKEKPPVAPKEAPETAKEAAPATTVEEKKDAPKDEKTTEERTEELLKEVRESLGVDITEDDIWEFLYNNTMTKKDIIIYPGKMHATFKYSLTLEETQAIDQAMASALERNYLEAGFKNLNTQHIMSYVLLELGKPGKTRPLGQTPKERFEAIGNMSSLLIEQLARKWNQFLFLLDSTLKKEEQVKKS